ncbi:MAG: class I SAM-dependent methyltransferase [Gemmatimonadota bacterium]|jgi:arsenite methyltransferase
MTIARMMAAQLREPSGIAGRLIMGGFFDRTSRRINEHTLDALEIESGESVLEVGFGGGAALESAAARAKEGTVVGVELSSVMVRRAERKCRRLVRQGRVRLYEGNVSDLPFDAGQFDRAYAVNTIYFWADPTGALREIRRVLKENGRLVLAIRSPEALAPYRFPEDILPAPKPGEVEASLQAAGFHAVRMEHRDRDQKLDTVLAIAHA